MSVGTPYSEGVVSSNPNSPSDASETATYESAMARMRPRAGDTATDSLSEVGSTTTDKSAEDAIDEAYERERDDDQEDKAARSRERNREHARRTRMRKKAHLQGLQHRVGELKQEAERLDVALGEVTTANILVDISHKRRKPDQDSTSILEMYDQDIDSSPVTSDEDSGIMDGSRATKKKRTGSQDQLGEGRNTHTHDMQLDAAGSNINWKDGYTLDAEGRRQPLSAAELEKLRRERNRMHAKKTRDRKKQLIANLEQTISELETKNRTRRQALGGSLARNLSHNSLTRFGAQYGVTGDEANSSAQ